MKKILKKLPAGLKPVSLQTMNFGMNHRLFLCFILGIIAGTFLINFFGEAYADKIGIYSEYAMGDIENLANAGFSKGLFFTYCIKKYIIELMIIVVVSCTSIWKTFDSIYCVYKGLAISILVSSATTAYGTGGLLLYIMSIFPHYLVYVPMIVFTLFLGMKMRENFKTNKLIMPVVKGLAIEGILIVVTAFLEAYCNYPFIQNMFK